MIIAFEEDDWDDFDRWRNILDKSKLYEDLINEFFELQPMTYEQRQSFIEDHINYYNTSMKEYRDSQIKRNTHQHPYKMAKMMDICTSI